ncbi:uncharacterized protein LOC123307326 [Coccinella septempunctata]|uniref:uncharacterized protein LOC123307326 n=1 Tax=Coccinella septempunctata TaxID=41139 RepID=UPI001D08F800|nr:uncharacterized protein LOC123307326 [Coccinella septempunctata]
MDLEILLIKCVKKERLLYDPRNGNYSNRNLKMKVWTNIALICGMSSGYEAKALWNKLRASYRASLNRNGVSGWKHGTRMKFLKPFLKDMNSGEGSFATNPVKHFPSYQEFVPTPCGSKNKYPVTPSFEKKNETSILNFQDAKKNEERSNGRKEIRKTLFENEDPLKAFFVSMYNTTKNLPVPLQKTVKKGIFQIVMKADEADEEFITSLSNSFDVRQPEACFSDSDSDEYSFPMITPKISCREIISS